MAKHNATGKEGEEIARRYLENKGYKIIERNWKTKRAEIDLVVQKKSILVIVEVRTKAGENFGTPEETLNHKKRHKLFMNARVYAASCKYAGLYRIDAVCVVLRGGGSKIPARITHYENIVEG